MFILTSALALVVLSGEPLGQVAVSGTMRVWKPVTFSISGPATNESALPNPFIDYRLEVAIWKGERRFRVPGFYAADGKAAETGAAAGNQWQALFSPEQAGTWTYRISFRKGPGVAISADSEAGQPIEPDGWTGSVEIRESVGDNPRGGLRYVGKRYLQFAGNGEFFLKAGADSPENFLSYSEFDQDEEGRNAAGSPREGEAAPSPRHRFAPHIGDWKAGDPLWRGNRGKGLIGALNYLGSQGVNSLYFLTMNIKGDGDDVWPYTHRNERRRFDCSRLAQWNIVFDHMDRLGIAQHVVLTETENESLFEVEEGSDFADSRKLYYRELVARFAHHPALQWNLGEENGWNDKGWDGPDPQRRANSDSQRKEFATYIRELDPYDHPIVVHTLPGAWEEIYRPLLGFEALEGPSLQIHDIGQVHSETLKWVDRSERSGRPWVVNLDEIGPADVGVKPDAVDPGHDDVRRFALWGNLMAGGGGCEWYFGYSFPDNDLSLEDFRSRELMWRQSLIAVKFFKDYLPFPEMRPSDHLITNAGGYCLALDRRVYAVYLGTGGSTRIRLADEVPSSYEILWYDPRRGGELQTGSLSRIPGGGLQEIGNPPSEVDRDWVALIRRLPSEAP